MTLERNEGARPHHCGECGALVEHGAEFHPYLFCVLKKARRDPWVDFCNAFTALTGLELPKRPPAVADLPIALPASPSLGGRMERAIEAGRAALSQPLRLYAVHPGGEQEPVDLDEAVAYVVRAALEIEGVAAGDTQASSGDLRPEAAHGPFEDLDGVSYCKGCGYSAAAIAVSASPLGCASPSLCPTCRASGENPCVDKRGREVPGHIGVHIGRPPMLAPPRSTLGGSEGGANHG